MMKQVKLLFLMAALITSVAASAQTSKVESAEQCVLDFLQAGDNSDVNALQTVLHPEFRVVMNQLFGSPGVSVLSKKDYLAKIEAKVFGGDKRSVHIESIQLNGKHALVRVMTQGEKMTFRSDLTLVQNADGGWQVISDVPTVL